MVYATGSSWSCFCWLYRTSPSLATMNIINLISVLTIWWCPCVVFSCVVGRECLLWPVRSLGKTLLDFALLQDPEIPQRLRLRIVFECLLWRYGSAVDCCGGRSSVCSRPGYGISCLGGGHHEPYHRAARTSIGRGNRLLAGTNRTLCAPGPRRKEQWPHKDWPRLALEYPGVSSRGVHGQWPAAGLGALSAAVHAWHLLKEVVIIFISSTIVWSNNREGA